jgi:hypothetical protein
VVLSFGKIMLPAASSTVVDSRYAIMRDILSVERRYEGFVAVHLYYSHVRLRGFDQFSYASDHLFHD